MKNPLADVLRQSGGSDHSLSDSGSFDTTESALGPTANDEHVVSDDAIDLQLLQATGALVLDNGTVRLEAGPELIRDEPELPITAAPLTEESGERAPAMSRFAPLICIAAAIVAAVSWAGYRYLQQSYTGSTLGAVELTAGDGVEPVPGTVHLAGAEQFPFINLEPAAASGDSK